MNQNLFFRFEARTAGPGEGERTGQRTNYERIQESHSRLEPTQGERDPNNADKT